MSNEIYVAAACSSAIVAKVLQTHRTWKLKCSKITCFPLYGCARLVKCLLYQH